MIFDAMKYETERKKEKKNSNSKMIGSKDKQHRRDWKERTWGHKSSTVLAFWKLTKKEKKFFSFVFF